MIKANFSPVRALLAIVFALLCFTQVQAQSNLRNAVVYDLRDREAVVTVGYKVREFPDFVVPGLTAEAWVLGTYGASSGVGSLGTALVAPFRLARNLTGYVGGAYLGSQARTASVGLIVGLSVSY